MRVKRGMVTRRKHNKLLGQTKGFRGTKSRLIRVGREAALHSGQYAYVGRKNRKRDFRRSWILRISEAVKLLGVNYSRFIKGLKDKKIIIDRKILADLVLTDPPVFKKIFHTVKN